MKKKRTSRFISFVLAAGMLASTQATPAHALIGLATGNVGLAVFGGIVAAAGGARVVGYQTRVVRDRHGRMHRILVRTVGYISAPTGLILLDAEGAMGAEFAEIDGKSAQSLGLTQDEKEAFNAEVAELNAVSENVAYDLVKSGRNDEQTAKQLWQSYVKSGSVSEEAFRGASKIVEGSFLTEAAQGNGVER